MNTKTPRTGRPRVLSKKADERVCSRCKSLQPSEYFLKRKDGVLSSYCKICRRSKLQEWRASHISPEILAKRIKRKNNPFQSYENKRMALISQFGCACQVCGYKKCHAALHFHHIDSSEKKKWYHNYYKSLLEVENYPKRFNLLCSNCHMEAHYL